MNKLIILDLDDTLIHEGFDIENAIMCEETLPVLEYLKLKKYIIALASHNHDGSSYLEVTGLHNYFNKVDCKYEININNQPSKINQIIRLISFFGIDVNNIYYYDDVEFHVNEARQLGIEHAYLVDYRKGIQYKDIISAGL